MRIAHRSWLWIWLVLVLTPMGRASEAPPLPFMKASDFSPFWPEATNAGATTPATITPFRFRSQANRILTERDLAGHVSLVNFFFGGCGSVCPRLMSQIGRVQKTLSTDRRVHFYSISVTPDEDTPPALADYAKTHRLDLRNWDLMTGDRAEIYRLGRDVFRADRNPDGGNSRSEFIHTQAIYLVDSQLRIRGVYQSDKRADMALLIQDVARLSGNSGLTRVDLP